MDKVAKQDLLKSGISTADAAHAEMFSVPSAQDIYDCFSPWPALVIPYYDPWEQDLMQFEHEGVVKDFCRVRYYHDNTAPKSFKKKKLVRYTQPNNSGIHAYFPIAEGIDWVAIAEDVTIPIMITEGEKKALAGCIAGIPTIGLGGVYNFSQDGELLPIMDRIRWKNRPVYICYDSDAANNEKIQLAEGRLATELSMKRRAEIFLPRLPDKSAGDKMGIDDFLVQEGTDALFDLLESSPQIRKIDAEVLRLNQEVIWIENEGMLIDLNSDQWIKKADFQNGSRFSSRKIEVMAMRGAGTKTVSISKEWLTHPLARRYDDTVFRPGSTDKAVPMPTGGIGYNRFRGLEGEEGDVAPFFELYDWLMSRTDEFDPDLLWKIIAYKIQNLEARINLGIMLLGKQGSGKTLFCDIVAGMVEPYNKVLASNEMGSDFNGWIETALIVVMNETNSAKLKFSMDKLKTYITDPIQTMNEKYRIVRQVESHALFLFNSNERSAGAFSNDDRRMVIIGCPDIHPNKDKFYEPIVKWMRDGGSQKLLHWMQNYDLDGWEPPHRAPETREKRMAYFASLTPVQKLGEQMQKATENIVFKWIASAMEWAASEAVGPSQGALASDILTVLPQVQIRPFYTPEELSLMFPSIAQSLQFGNKGKTAGPGVLAQELIQMGIEYLRCADNFDGFMYKGQVRQFLIISNAEDYRDPITQKEFNKLVDEFPTYGQWRKDMRAKVKKRGAKRKPLTES